MKILSKNTGLRKTSNNLLILIVIIAFTGIYACIRSKTVNHSDDKSEMLKIKFNINTTSSDLLLKWFDKQSDTNITKEILKQPGTQIMAGIVENTLSQNELPTFSYELKNFSINDSLKPDPYGLRLAWFQKGESSLLFRLLKSQ